MNLPVQLAPHPGHAMGRRRSALTLLPPSLATPHWRSQVSAASEASSKGEPKLVLYTRVLRWVAERPEFPNAEQVEDEFGVHKATANRWLNAIAEAYGVDRPRRNRGGRNWTPATSASPGD